MVWQGRRGPAIKTDLGRHQLVVACRDARHRPADMARLWLHQQRHTAASAQYTANALAPMPASHLVFSALASRLSGRLRKNCPRCRREAWRARRLDVALLELL